MSLALFIHPTCSKCNTGRTHEKSFKYRKWQFAKITVTSLAFLSNVSCCPHGFLLVNRANLHVKDDRTWAWWKDLQGFTSPTCTNHLKFINFSARFAVAVRWLWDRHSLHFSLPPSLVCVCGLSGARRSCCGPTLGISEGRNCHPSAIKPNQLLPRKTSVSHFDPRLTVNKVSSSHESDSRY